MRRQTARSGADLAAAGVIGPERATEVDRVGGVFATAVSPTLFDAMRPGDPTDPVFRQFVPSEAELDTLPEELADPIGDGAHAPVKGIVHRYPDRVLLKPVHVCPVYCRFCFRREVVGPGSETLSEAELAAALDYVRAHPEIWEVILSGGDPLVLSPRRLGAIVAALDAIPHVAVVRIHTRVPVAEPARVTPALVAALKADTPVWVVLHCNHANELGAPARAACAALVDAGLPMLAQTVLLKGVNDDPATMTDLLRALVRNRIKPYYLHHPDLARGTSHFRPDVAAGQALMRSLRGTISGVCQPAYVLDIPGGHGKVPIGPGYISEPGPDGGRTVTDPTGRHHAYPPRGPA